MTGLGTNQLRTSTPVLLDMKLDMAAPETPLHDNMHDLALLLLLQIRVTSCIPVQQPCYLRLKLQCAYGIAVLLTSN